jgi:hypothetical protein
MDNFNTNDDLKVRQRAYALWEAAGCPEGREEEHWLQAEEEIRRAERGDGLQGSDAPPLPVKRAARQRTSAG